MSKRILFVSEYFHGEPETEVGGVFQRRQLFIDAAYALGELDILFYVHHGIATSTESVARWQDILSQDWGISFTLHLCHLYDPNVDRPHLYDRLRFHASMLRRGVFNVTNKELGLSTSGDMQVRAFEDCLNRDPNLVIAHRLGAISPMALSNCRIPPILLDMDDVEHVRYGRFLDEKRSLGVDVASQLKLKLLLLSEARALRTAHSTFVCSERDREILQTVEPKSNIVTIPNAVSAHQLARAPDSHNVLFIGYFGYEPNALAANHLITKIWPVISQAAPEARLLIAGKNPENIDMYGRVDDTVRFLGFVEDLDALYARTNLVACPIQIGSGTRVKIIEAAAYGKPVVATSIAAEGLDFEEGSEIIIRDSSSDFATACVALLKDRKLASKIGRQASVRVKQNYNRENIVSSLSLFMDGVAAKAASPW